MLLGIGNNFCVRDSAYKQPRPPCFALRQWLIIQPFVYSGEIELIDLPRELSSNERPRYALSYWYIRVFLWQRLGLCSFVLYSDAMRMSKVVTYCLLVKCQNSFLMCINGQETARTRGTTLVICYNFCIHFLLSRPAIFNFCHYSCYLLLSLS